MKKLLLPSVLAGLMICAPTSLVRADPVIYYSPYDWSSNVQSYSNSFTDMYHIVTAASYSATPTPSGIQFLTSASVSLPSGYPFGSSRLTGTQSTNDTVWHYTGGGSPANYDEIPIFQYMSSVTGYGYCAFYDAEIDTHIDPTPETAAGSYTKYTDGSTGGNPLAQFALSKPRTGAMVLTARTKGTMRTEAIVTGNSVRSSTVTGNATLQVDYIVP